MEEISRENKVGILGRLERHGSCSQGFAMHLNWYDDTKRKVNPLVCLAWALEYAQLVTGQLMYKNRAW
jgi:hypothetical protein